MILGHFWSTSKINAIFTTVNGKSSEDQDALDNNFVALKYEIMVENLIFMQNNT